MDRNTSKPGLYRLAILGVLSTVSGCVTPPIPTATVWDKLGITGASARLRDATINRSGNFPNLEKKPPLLRIADPENLKAEKPEMVKTAAKVKQDQDLKKQKIKALKFLGEVKCGCYNKDKQVEKAFLAGLEDCDPDVRTASIEALCVAAGNCASCRNGCATTCCTEDILKMLQDMAYGCDDKGCPKEPSAEIRKLAAALIRKCPCPPAKPIEEVPAPPPSEVEEIVSPEDKPEGPTGGANNSGEDVSASRARQTPAHVVRHRLSSDEWGNGTEQVVVARSTTTIVQPGSTPIISNPDLLIPSKVVSCNLNLGEVLVELPDNYQVKIGSSMVLVGTNKVQSVGVVTESSGRRLLVALANPAEASGLQSGSVRVGLIKSAK